MKFERKKFFDGVKDRIDPTLNQGQVDGLEFLLGRFEQTVWNIPKISYAFATIFHETAGTFQPINEYGSIDYFNNRYGPKTAVGKDLGNIKAGDGARYRGRGYVQLTGRSNYRHFGFEDKPTAVLEPDNAFQILQDGMVTGAFTGKKLSDYIHGNTADYVGARKIINGKDRAGMIAGYAKSFEKILNSAATTINPAISANPPTNTEIQSPQPNSEPPPITDVTLTAPAKDGTTATATKLTIAGFAVPAFLATAIEAVKDLVQNGYISAAEIGTTVLSFIRDNQKYVFWMTGLIVGVMLIKKILKQITLWFSMLTHAVPRWNNVKVEPAEPESSVFTVFGK